MATQKTPQLEDILTLLLGSRMGGGSDLSAIIEALGKMGDPRKRAPERNVNTDMTDEFFDQWNETEYGPKASGVPYIFTGGSVFPQTEGQKSAQNMAGTLGLGGNMVDTLGSILSAWQDRKKRGGS